MSIFNSKFRNFPSLAVGGSPSESGFVLESYDGYHCRRLHLSHLRSLIYCGLVIPHGGWYRCWLTLVRCLAAPSHYLNSYCQSLMSIIPLEIKFNQHTNVCNRCSYSRKCIWKYWPCCSEPGVLKGTLSPNYYNIASNLIFVDYLFD